VCSGCDCAAVEIKSRTAQRRGVRARRRLQTIMLRGLRRRRWTRPAGHLNLLSGADLVDTQYPELRRRLDAHLDAPAVAAKQVISIGLG